MDNQEKYYNVCWDITARCNTECSYCYRDRKGTELSLKENKKIMDNLIINNVKKISFVGGEPILYPYLFDLIDYAKNKYPKKGTKFSLTTNAKSFFINGEKLVINEYMMLKVAKYFDWLTLSLDGYNNESQIQAGRESRHFDRVVFVLEYLKKKNLDIQLKINTVVSSKNYLYVDKIYDVIKDFGIKRWKFLRFLPTRGSALERSSEFSISSLDFKQAMDKVLSQQIIGIIVTKNDFDDFNKSYINISVDGFVVDYDDGEYVNSINLRVNSLEKILGNKGFNYDWHKTRRFDYIK